MRRCFLANKNEEVAEGLDIYLHQSIIIIFSIYHSRDRASFDWSYAYNTEVLFAFTYLLYCTFYNEILLALAPAL